MLVHGGMVSWSVVQLNEITPSFRAEECCLSYDAGFERSIFLQFSIFDHVFEKASGLPFQFAPLRNARSTSAALSLWLMRRQRRVSVFAA
ncbi:unnamed protein product [Coffea canephora]|uniref:Uncharacterized protein n=1 Tax=Coffea canephora TaxID=49390 RepID=A0A068UQ61_COFCA|nr:unnamed protein product [Coffea canephora]